jgi:hypothetical protein
MKRYNKAVFKTGLYQLDSNDPITGLPYPIAPTPAPSGVYDLWEDDHHAFYWNRAPQLQGQDGKAVRHSRIQRTPRWAHNRYHQTFENGIELPQNEHEKFCIGVLACSGLVPRRAIDLSGIYPRIMELDEKDHSYLRESRRIHPESYINKRTHRDDLAKRRGIFFMNYVLNNKLEEIKPAVLEQFLEMSEAKDYEHKVQLGWFIVSKAIELATHPILPIYRQAQQLGMADSTCPKGPVATIKTVVKNHPINYFDELEEKAERVLQSA